MSGELEIKLQVLLEGRKRFISNNRHPKANNKKNA